jgi:quercetin dioxygenase-like cupin family protein
MMVVGKDKLTGAFKGFRARETGGALTAATLATPCMAQATPHVSWRRARGALVAIVCSLMVLATCEHVLAQGGTSCKPVSERTGEVGCWIMADVPLGELSQAEVFWHLDRYPSRAAAEAAKGPHGTVMEALGNVWLFTIGEAGWRPAGGVRVAEIGPLLVKSREQYTARYMESIFTPGMTSPTHRHPGPEAWYTTGGEVCLETPEGKTVGRAGESTIVQAGAPMHLTATGSEQRRSLVLILHESSQPSGKPATDWTPKGLCKN